MKRIARTFTIKQKDYKGLKEIVSRGNPTESEKELLLEVIREHEFVSKFRDEVIKTQNDTAEGLFSLSAEVITAIAASESQSAPDDSFELSETETDEDRLDEVNEPSETKSDDGNSPTEPKTRGKKALPKGKICRHVLSESERTCPCCAKKMAIIRSKERTTVFSQPLIYTRTDIAESCHCEVCDVTATAATPEDTKDTIGRYHFSAVANLAALRYLWGMASLRLQEYSRNVGLNISDSTQWALFEEAAGRLLKFVQFLKNEAANSGTCYVDDTHQLIISIAREIEDEQNEALRNGKNPERVRSGIHTTNMTAEFPDGQIVLYQSGLHHAGEALAGLLSKRTTEEQIVIMADASSSNTSKLKGTSADVKVSNCNAHGVRKFKELAKAEKEAAEGLLIDDHKVSEEIGFFLRGYKRIFENDRHAKSLAPPERLAFHAKESLPIMEAMRDKIEKNFAKKRVEPNSAVGAAYRYFLNHWQELAAFCVVEGAPVSNNLCERMLKSAIRHRKNSLFFKTQVGAAVGDILTSVLMTAKANELNPVEYLQNLLTHRDHWLQSPKDWLPWNYPATMARLNQSSRS